MGWGAVDRNRKFVGGGGVAPAAGNSNNQAELLALLCAIEQHPKGDRTGCRIESDSQYALYSVTRWWELAQARGGRTSAKKKRANNELICRVKAALDERPGLELAWRKGHSPDNELNALCDAHAMRLALEAAEQVAAS